jgi:hypothetical protein
VPLPSPSLAPLARFRLLFGSLLGPWFASHAGLPLALVAALIPLACVPASPAEAPTGPAAQTSADTIAHVDAVAPTAAPTTAPSTVSKTNDAPGEAKPAANASGAEARRRWLYRLETRSESGEEKTTVLSFVEDRRVLVKKPKSSEPLLRIDLVAEHGGSRATRQDFENDGYPHTPIDQEMLHPRWTFVVGVGARGKTTDHSLWFLTSDTPLADEELLERLSRPADIASLGRAGPPPSNPPTDRTYVFARAGTEAGATERSACMGFLHPAPESGDVFDVERCFSVEHGLTHGAIHSVWGSYELDLVRGPNDTLLAPANPNRVAAPATAAAPAGR